MDFGGIESDPLKFCEDFKKFSEKNQDTFVNAQMDIEGQVQIFFRFIKFRFVNFDLQKVAIQSLAEISADFDRIHTMGKKTISAIQEKLLSQKKIIDDQAPDNEKLAYLSDFDRKVDGDIEPKAVLEEIRDALGNVSLETPAEYKEAIENITKYVHYDRLDYDDSGIQKALYDLEAQIKNFAEQSIEWSLKIPKPAVTKEAELPSPREPGHTPQGTSFENFNNLTFFRRF